jgi:hypothetical protein
LIINSIKSFANALTEFNFSKRVAELFTALESLILKDTSVPIIDSLHRYCPKLIYIRDSNSVISLINKMYKVRCDYIHHAKESDVKPEVLSKLQQTVHLVLITLIKNSNIWKDKSDMIAAVDSTI